VRALEVLLAQGLIVVEESRTARGYPRSRRVIVFSELALLCCDELALKFGRVKVSAPQAPQGNPGAPAGTEPSAPAAKPSAPAAKPSAPAAKPSAPEGQPSAHRGTLNELNAIQETIEAPSVRNDAADRGADEPADVPADGARYFFSDELAVIRAKANTLNKRAQANTPGDRELLLKIATLWHDGRICEDAIQQVLESYQRKAEQGDPVRKPVGWLWVSLGNQCRVRGGPRLEQLLATTDFPCELLPAAAAAQTPGGT
jgi:hypothetical protein